MSNSFQEQLDQAFPDSSDANVIRAVSEGVLLADTLVENEGFLKTLVGKDSRGLLRRAGILYRLHIMAESGDLPFSSKMTRMPRGGWHWIELENEKFKAHVCRTDGPTLFPEDTPTRQDDRLSNQLNLFKLVKSEADIQSRVAWLMFGVGDSGALGHLCWGMPNAQGDEWLARTNVLSRIEATRAIEKPKNLESSMKLRFRQHVEATLDESGNKAEES